MLGVRDYSDSCDFIIKEFKIDKESNVYVLMNTIVEEYKLLKDKLLVAEDKAKKVTLKKEKKRGRPRKSSSN